MTEPRGLQALAEFPAHDRCLEICRDAGMPGFGAGSSITRGRFEAYEVLYNVVQSAAAERQRLVQAPEPINPAVETSSSDVAGLAASQENAPTEPVPDVQGVVGATDNRRSRRHRPRPKKKK
jgi:hypothetical protein